MKLVEGLENLKIVDQSEATKKSWTRYLENKERDWGLYGHDTGIHDLNMAIGGWIPTKLTTIAGRSGHGKCLGFGTKVVKYSGKLEKVQNLKKGDVLLGIDGSPNKITSVCSGRENLYKIKQNKAIDYVVNESHIISVETAYGKKRDRHIERNICIKDFMKESKTRQRFSYGYKRSAIFNSGYTKNLKIDPYFLGIWLGDGSSDNTSVFTVDQEIKDYMRNFAENSGLKYAEGKDKRNDVVECKILGIRNRQNPLRNTLRELGIFNNKHIPLDFIVSDRKDRLNLLAGLIDTDGSITSDGAGYEITQKRKELSYNIKYLCDSLAYRTGIHEKLINNTIYYRVYFYGNNLEEIPVQIDRKAIKKKNKRPVNKSRTGINIEPIGEGNYYGFTLENEDKRFFLEDFTVTHNTALTNAIFDAGSRVLNGRRAEFCFFTWEMESSYLVDRFVSYKTGISSRWITQGSKFLSDHQSELIKAAYHEAEKLPLQYQEMSLDIGKLKKVFLEFVKKVREKEKVEGVKIIPVGIIDFINMAQFSNLGLRTYGIGEYMAQLKSLCNQTGAAFMVIAQINRSADEREVPERSDLSDSQSIENNSDNLIIVHRPEYNGVEFVKDPRTSDEVSSKNRMIMRVLKGRDFGTGDFLIGCDVKNYKFWSLDQDRDFPYWELYNQENFWKDQFKIT